MANVKNPANILLGTGILYLDGQDVGQLSGDVVLTYSTEFKKIQAGFPKTTVKSRLIAEEAKITAGFLEVDIQKLAILLPQFALENVAGTPTAVANEYVGALSASAWKGTANRNWDPSETVTVRLASKLLAGATVGATKIYVEDASLFSPGDTVTLVKSGATEDKTIAALGVDTGENSLTFTEGLAAAFSAGDAAVNTAVSLVHGTDFLFNPIDGTLLMLEDSTKISEGDTVSVSYTYVPHTGQSLFAGGNISTATFPLEFRHTRDDGKIFKVKFPQAQITGNFELPFHEDSETILNVTIESVADPTKPSGKQLVEITLEDAA